MENGFLMSQGGAAYGGYVDNGWGDVGQATFQPTADMTTTAVADTTAATGIGEGVKRVYVGNLPYECSWRDLKDHFRQCGDVAYTTCKRGWGIVEFGTEADAAHAISVMNNTNFMGRDLNVREDRGRVGGGGGGGGAGFKGSAGSRGGYQGSSSGARGSGSAANEGCSIFIENLAWEVRWQNLKDFGREAAPVVHAEVFTGYQGKSKGCGRIEFETPEGAASAIELLDGLALMGRNVAVRAYEDNRESGRSKRGGGGGGGYQRGSGFGGGRQNAAVSDGTGTKLFVGNLSWGTSSEDLLDAFTGLGEVVHAEVISGYDGRSRGFGIVTMKTNQEAKDAIDALADTDLDGRNIQVRFDQKN